MNSCSKSLNTAAERDGTKVGDRGTEDHVVIDHSVRFATFNTQLNSWFCCSAKDCAA